MTMPLEVPRLDPDAALENLRALVSDPGPDSVRTALDTLDELREQFNALDEWLSRGGALPHAWERMTR